MPRKRVLVTAVALALSAPVFEAHSQSIAPTTLPTGGRVVAGQASISQSGAAMQIQQGSAKAALDWNSFSIGSQAAVTFNQPSASAIALNRVLGASGSEIYGRLSANGQVFLLNPNGVLFAPGSQVDVGGLVASTLTMSSDDFLAGRYRLSGGGVGSVVNQGSIKGRSVALIAPQVTNDGTIEAQSGTVSLTAAGAATLDYMADGLVQIKVDQGALAAQVANNGLLRADGGRIELTATAMDSLARSVVNNTGIIEAHTVENVGGVVRLAGGSITHSGTIRGGTDVLFGGDEVLLVGGSSVTTAVQGRVEISAPSLAALHGTISAPDGHVDVNAASVMSSGVANVRSGTIDIGAGSIYLDGQLSANSNKTGGAINLVARTVDVASSGVISADGSDGGAIRLASADGGVGSPGTELEFAL